MGQASAATGGVGGTPAKYDRSRQGQAEGLVTSAAAYNPDADVTASAGASDTKKQKVCLHLLLFILVVCKHS